VIVLRNTHHHTSASANGRDDDHILGLLVLMVTIHRGVGWPDIQQVRTGAYRAARVPWGVGTQVGVRLVWALEEELHFQAADTPKNYALVATSIPHIVHLNYCLLEGSVVIFLRRMMACSEKSCMTKSEHVGAAADPLVADDESGNIDTSGFFRMIDGWMDAHTVRMNLGKRLRTENEVSVQETRGFHSLERRFYHPMSSASLDATRISEVVTLVTVER